MSSVARSLSPWSVGRSVDQFTFARWVSFVGLSVCLWFRVPKRILFRVILADRLTRRLGGEWMLQAGRLDSTRLAIEEENDVLYVVSACVVLLFPIVVRAAH